MRFTAVTEAEIQTGISAEEVVKRLAGQIEEPSLWNKFLPVKRKPFIGSISDRQFSCFSTFNASRISGVIRPGEKGTIIKIKCKLNPVSNGVVWGMLIGFSIVSVFVSLAAIYTILTKGITAVPFWSPGVFIPILSPFIPYLSYLQNMRRILNSNVDFLNELFKVTDLKKN